MALKKCAGVHLVHLSLLTSGQNLAGIQNLEHFLKRLLLYLGCSLVIGKEVKIGGPRGTSKMPQYNVGGWEGTRGHGGGWQCGSEGGI